MRAFATLATLGTFAAALSACSLVGFDDLVTEPCGALADDSIEAIRASNELCASIESTRPAVEGTTWVCREPVGDDLFCVESSVDNDNDGVGAESQGGLDCNDDDPEIFGGQEELLCDGKDNDCDGNTDENLINAQMGTRIYSDSVALGSFASTATQFSFIGRRAELLEVVVEGNTFTIPQSLTASYAAAPVGTQAIVLGRSPEPDAPYRLFPTSDPDGGTENLTDANVTFPAIGVGERAFLAAWFNDEGTACGASAGPFRYTSGLSSAGVDSAAPMDLPDASPIQAPVIVPVGEEFLVFAANGSAIDAHLVTRTSVVASVSFPFDDDVSAFAVASGESDSDALKLGLVAAVGCTTRDLVFQELTYDLTTGIVSPGEITLTEERGAAPAMVWSAASRGFVITWVAGDAQRTLLGRLISVDGVSGAVFDVTDAIPNAAAFPYGSALGPALGGGLRLWTYARGPEEGVYEIALGCGMQ